MGGDVDAGAQGKRKREALHEVTGKAVNHNKSKQAEGKGKGKATKATVRKQGKVMTYLEMRKARYASAKASRAARNLYKAEEQKLVKELGRRLTHVSIAFLLDVRQTDRLFSRRRKLVLRCASITKSSRMSGEIWKRASLSSHR